MKEVACNQSTCDHQDHHSIKRILHIGRRQNQVHNSIITKSILIKLSFHSQCWHLDQLCGSHLSAHPLQKLENVTSK
jgi:hypothetical protein